MTFDRLPREQLPEDERTLEEFLRDFEADIAEDRRAERAFWRRSFIAAIALCGFFALLLLSGCGGGSECRPDIMGPPAPEVAHLPVCAEGEA
jgi:hypothetical protein